MPEATFANPPTRPADGGSSNLFDKYKAWLHEAPWHVWLSLGLGAVAVYLAWRSFQNSNPANSLDTVPASGTDTPLFPSSQAASGTPTVTPTPSTPVAPTNLNYPYGPPAPYVGPAGHVHGDSLATNAGYPVGPPAPYVGPAGHTGTRIPIVPNIPLLRSLGQQRANTVEAQYALPHIAQGPSLAASGRTPALGQQRANAIHASYALPHIAQAPSAQRRQVFALGQSRANAREG